jgi:hypothetical protein
VQNLDQSFFIAGSEERIILLVSLLWLVCEIVGGKILPRLRGGGTVKAGDDSGSRLIIVLSIFVSAAIAFYFGKNGITPLPGAFFYAGMVLMSVGIVFRQCDMGSGAFLLDKRANP